MQPALIFFALLCSAAASFSPNTTKYHRRSSAASACTSTILTRIHSPASCSNADATPNRESVILQLSVNTNNDGVDLDFHSLMDMDVVLFKRRASNDDGEESKLELGAMQEDGTVAPLSAWTLESAFASGSSDSIEFLVDEEDRFPGLTAEDVSIVSILDESVIAYGSRQVGGGMGPGNPHGEESEITYYVERSVIEGNGDADAKIEVVLKPELEIFW